MGETCDQACVISLSFTVTGAQLQVPKHRMHILLALLCVFLVETPGCSCLPTKGDSITNTRTSIINIAQITLVHIKKLKTELPVPQHTELSSPSIDGLNSISHDLGHLDNELQSPLTEIFSQIQADVSSLVGRVRSLAQTMGCTIQARPREETSGNLFPDSHLYLTLTKVQLYLDKFLLNKDKLKVC